MTITRWIAVVAVGVATASAQPPEVWMRNWDGPGHHQDSIKKIAHGPDGSVSAVGLSRAADGIADMVTIRYAADGTLAWAAVYGNIPGRADDGRGVAVDAAGNTYALGVSYNGDRNQGGSDFDYVLFKHAPAGELLWMRRYNGPGNWADQPLALCVDALGNSYIAGGAFYQPSPSGGYATDFHVVKYSPSGDLLWEYHTPSQTLRGAIANAATLGPDGNLHVTGYSIEAGGNQDFLTVKLTSDGQLVHRSQHSTAGFNTGSDEGLAVAADAAGNTYVAGYWRPDPVAGEPDRHLDTMTLKYSPTGDLLWTYSTSRPREEAATAIVVDGDGNVYVAGAWLAATENNGWIESYSADGALRWTYEFDEPGAYDENWFVDLKWGADGRLYAGVDNERVTGYDPTVVVFATDGALLSRESYDAGTSSDSCFAFDVDPAGNLYFGGNSYFGAAGSDLLIIKVSPALPALRGDANCDGSVDFFDIDPFVLAIFDPAAYAGLYCGGDMGAADCNADGDVNFFDIDPFLACLFEVCP